MYAVFAILRSLNFPHFNNTLFSYDQLDMALIMVQQVGGARPLLCLF